MSVFERLRRIVAASFQVPLDSVTADTNIEDYADSLGIVELGMAIEEEFDLSFPDQQTIEHPPRTVGQIAKYIEKHISQ